MKSSKQNEKNYWAVYNSIIQDKDATHMKTSKNTIFFLISELLLLGVFNVVAFILPFLKNGGFWTGYGFGTLAIALSACVSLFALRKDSMKSKFYGIPQVVLVFFYAILQTVLSVAEMALSFIPFQYLMLVNVILLVVVLLGLIGAEAGKGFVEEIGNKVKEKVFFIKAMQGDLEALAVQVTEPVLKKAIMALSETVRFSDPMSSPQLATLESGIEEKVSELKKIAHTNNDEAIRLCGGLQDLFAERNRKCKLLK